MLANIKTMKHLLNIGFFLCIQLIVAQDLNQMDANGKRHGLWKKTFPGTDVVRYQGEFDHGKEVGVFKFYKNIDGAPVLFATKQFNPKDNLALVKFYTAKGHVVSQGKMDGKKHIGQWLYYHKNSTNVMRQETYNNAGELHGKVLIYYKNGTLAEQSHYRNGQMNGQSVIYSESGVKLKAFTYLHGKLDGPAKFYTSSGDLILEGQYKNDKKQGVWTYYKNGKVTDTKRY